MHSLPVLGPTLNCVGFTTCSVDGECKCYFNGNLQYGVCMELTVEVGNASTDLNCQWYVRMNGMYVEQDKTDPNDFFVVKGNKSQVCLYVCVCVMCVHAHTHTYECMYAHIYSCLWTQEHMCALTCTHTACTHIKGILHTHITHMPHTHTCTHARTLV